MKHLFKLTLIAATLIGITRCQMMTGNNIKGDSMIITNGLIAFYPLDGNGTDIIGGYNGKMVGTTPTEDRFGRQGKAMAFNGVEDEVIIKNPPPLNRNGATVAIWVKFESEGENIEWKDVFDGKGFSQPILSQDDGNGIRVFLISLWKGMARSNGQGSGWSLLPVDGEKVKVGQWYHIAIVRGEKHQLFVNGKQVQVKPDVFNVCQCQPWLIGATRAWGKQNPHLHGAVDDIRVYERALNKDEILALSQETKKGK